MQVADSEGTQGYISFAGCIQPHPKCKFAFSKKKTEEKLFSTAQQSSFAALNHY
jgi:hypothetical protein